MRKILAALMAFCLLALYAPTPLAEASSKYYITVDITNQIVTVYDSENTAETNIVRQMICSTGRTATPTPQGTYTLPSKWQSSERSEWYYFPKYKCYAKWATRITGGILFHSTLFTSAKRGPTSASTRALGSKASHGCVRLRVNDAKFIAQNCLSGTKVKIYSSGKTNSKLRTKLKKKSFIRENQTYDSFMGRKPVESTIPLSKGSTGTLVTQLQTRLKALGFYSGAVNGVMGTSTVTAVKAFESASGMSKTGKVTQTVWDSIFSDSAVTGTVVTLSQGSTGPAVTTLQNNLVTLLMLSGDVDGSYGSQTAEAVKNYQNTFGFSATGSADTELQNDIASRAAKVRASFGDSGYALGVVTTEARMAKVKAKSGTRLRKTASKSGKSLKKLKYQAAMRVLSEGKTWSKVKYGTRTGYVKKSTLRFYNETVEENGYVAVDATPEPTVEPTPTPTPEIYIPTATPEVYIPTSTDGETVAAAAGITLEADELIYGSEPVETPEPEDEDEDNGLALEIEPTPAPTPEATPEPEAVEGDIEENLEEPLED